MKARMLGAHGSPRRGPGSLGWPPVRLLCVLPLFIHWWCGWHHCPHFLGEGTKGLENLRCTSPTLGGPWAHSNLAPRKWTQQGRAPAGLR